MIDWAEGHHVMKQLVSELYDAMLWHRTEEAKALCDRIVVEARLTKAQIGAQESNNV